MSAIAGIEGRSDGDRIVAEMLDRIAHRGKAGRAVHETSGNHLGVIWSGAQDITELSGAGFVRDYTGGSHYAESSVVGGKLSLSRDRLGVVPLYYGQTSGGNLCFASEARALIPLVRAIHELPPGYECTPDGIERYTELAPGEPLADAPEVIAVELRRRLEQAVQGRIHTDAMGAWLSGGLDSSLMCALARPRLRTLHTFAVGLAGAPDLECAAIVADTIGSEHHARVVNPAELIAAVPRVVQSLESFDAWLVRSSIMNYLVAQEAEQYVGEVLSGEGGDELFAGYDYLKGMDPGELESELLDITGRLHNTALQRVDRCALAHGLVPHVCFLEDDVVDYALRIPAELKLRGGVEKWILRRAAEPLLPRKILDRPKAKFWEGAGVHNLVEQYAEARISDSDFQRERLLANGWTLNSKEELLYYRFFQERFGDLDNLDWMGRSKGARSVAPTV